MQEQTLEHYDNNASQLVERYDKIEFSDFQSELLRNFTGINKVLEIGCGSAREAAFLSSHGLEVIGEIHRVLRPGGLFFFSVSLERDDIDRQTSLDRTSTLT